MVQMNAKLRQMSTAVLQHQNKQTKRKETIQESVCSCGVMSDLRPSESNATRPDVLNTTCVVDICLHL
jgi:hypothetical protein